MAQFFAWRVGMQLFDPDRHRYHSVEKNKTIGGNVLHEGPGSKNCDIKNCMRVGCALECVGFYFSGWNFLNCSCSSSKCVD